ncbi:MAG: ABC transporter permease [Thermodesulfobacteriota bacterium]
MNHPLYQLTRARFLEFIRDPEPIFWVFVFPVLLALVLGFAFRNQGPETVRVALSGNAAEAVLALVAKDQKDPNSGDILWRVENSGQAETNLGSGRADLWIAAKSNPAAPPALIFTYDPQRPGAREARLAAENAVQQAFGRRDAVTIATVEVKEKGSRYIDFLIPGLIGLNVMGSCMWGMGYAIVDFRRRKLIMRMAVTPMRREHFLLAFILSRLLFLVLEAGLLLTVGWLVFGTRVRGSVFLFALLCLFGTWAFAGLALLIASRTRSTEAASGWMNLVQVPMWLFSGSFFSYSRFPESVQPILRLLPLTALNDGTRAVLNQGAGLATVLMPMAVMAVWGSLAFLAALLLFRWK